MRRGKKKLARSISMGEGGGELGYGKSMTRGGARTVKKKSYKQEKGKIQAVHFNWEMTTQNFHLRNLPRARLTYP